MNSNTIILLILLSKTAFMASLTASRSPHLTVSVEDEKMDHKVKHLIFFQFRVKWLRVEKSFLLHSRGIARGARGGGGNCPLSRKLYPPPHLTPYFWSQYQYHCRRRKIKSLQLFIAPQPKKTAVEILLKITIIQL